MGSYPGQHFLVNKSANAGSKVSTLDSPGLRVLYIENCFNFAQSPNSSYGSAQSRFTDPLKYEMPARNQATRPGVIAQHSCIQDLESEHRTLARAILGISPGNTMFADQAQT
jgi:hypothetical protein